MACSEVSKSLNLLNVIISARTADLNASPDQRIVQLGHYVLLLGHLVFNWHILYRMCNSRCFLQPIFKEKIPTILVILLDAVSSLLLHYKTHFLVNKQSEPKQKCGTLPSSNSSCSLWGLERDVSNLGPF